MFQDAFLPLHVSRPVSANNASENRLTLADVHTIRAVYDAAGALVGIASGLAIPALAALHVRRLIKRIDHAHSDNTVAASRANLHPATEARPVACGNTSNVPASEDA